MPATFPSSLVALERDSSSPPVHGKENVDAIEEDRATEDIVSLSSLSSEERDRKVFMQDLNKFMGELGKPLSKIPIMGYKELDLFQLFREVTAYGGFNEVVKNVGTWSKIWKRLGNFDPSITDSSFRLKKNYERYLLEYEYKVFPEHRQQAIEFEKQMHSKRNHVHDPANGANGNVPTNGPHRPKNVKKHKKRASSNNYVPHKDNASPSVSPTNNGDAVKQEGDSSPLTLSSGMPQLEGSELIFEVIGEINPSKKKRKISSDSEDGMLLLLKAKKKHRSHKHHRHHHRRHHHHPHEVDEDVDMVAASPLFVPVGLPLETHFSARTVVFSTREEMDDLENAVATLQALKNCAVY